MSQIEIEFDDSYKESMKSKRIDSIQPKLSKGSNDTLFQTQN